MAKQCGLITQEWTLQKIGKKQVLVVKRFDRVEQKRIPFLSAMSMLNAVDNDSQVHSYMDIADSLRQF